MFRALLGSDLEPVTVFYVQEIQREIRFLIFRKGCWEWAWGSEIIPITPDTIK